VWRSGHDQTTCGNDSATQGRAPSSANLSGCGAYEGLVPCAPRGHSFTRRCGDTTRAARNNVPLPRAQRAPRLPRPLPTGRALPRKGGARGEADRRQ
jgi:hypothetical protein